jgi:hypothetical protein
VHSALRVILVEYWLERRCHTGIGEWMVHVYPYESDAKKIWSTDDDDEGHDNMDHSTMPGMKMN